jgi:hypothetical protein
MALTPYLWSRSSQTGERRDRKECQGMSSLEPHHEVDEDLPESGHRTSRPLVITVVVTLAVAVAVLLVLERRHTHHREAARPATSSAVKPAPSPDDAVGLLVPGLAFAADTDSSSILYFADLLNGSDESLSIDYPIELRGPGGALIPVAFAGVVAHSAGIKYLRSRASGRPPELTKVAARESVGLLIQVHIDCVRAAAEERWPADQPAILVHINGLHEPARFTFPSELGGFASLARHACRK